MKTTPINKKILKVACIVSLFLFTPAFSAAPTFPDIAGSLLREIQIERTEDIADSGFGITTLVSLSSTGVQGNSTSDQPAISSDGRYIAFSSYATNLVENDDNGECDVFVRDRKTGITVLASVNDDGEQADGRSYKPAISGNGLFVAFFSEATNLVNNDTNGVWDVFVRDLKAGTTERVSVRYIDDILIEGNAMSGDYYAFVDTRPAISSDGRFVAFHSYASNLVDDDYNNARDIFVFDRRYRETIRVSVSSDGEEGDNDSNAPSISGDGRYVAFHSAATNLVDPEPLMASTGNVYRHELSTQTTKLISKVGRYNATFPSLSADGRYVAFSSAETNNGPTHIYRYDVFSDQTERVSVNSLEINADRGAFNPRISGDGQMVTFITDATNLDLVVQDTNGQIDIFVRDIIAGETHRVNLSTDGDQGDTGADGSFLTEDGKCVVFASRATTLVDNDQDSIIDVFLNDRGCILGFLDLPFSYQNFEITASGNTGVGSGRINSWFDHSYPTYTSTPNAGTNDLTLYNGRVFDFNIVPPQQGISWYDGHDGIDFSGASGTPVLAAAGGEVSNESTRWGCLGWHVILDHDNGYRTVYGHLRDLPTVTGHVDKGEQIGVIGNTFRLPCRSTGAHLHFQVLVDPNNDGNWDDQRTVDPYGWSGEPALDPWEWNPADSLWIYPLVGQGQVDSNGGGVASPSGIYSVVAPAGATNQSITFELLIEPPVAGASAQLHTAGRSFWLRVLEWLTSGTNRMTAITDDFSVPITVNMNYSGVNLDHLNENELRIAWWSEIGNNWVELPTVLDMTSKIASAQTLNIGHFDLQAPLACPADVNEIDDDHYLAAEIRVNGVAAGRYFDNPSDTDWVRFFATPERQYIIETMTLAQNVDTILELYDRDGDTLLVSDDDSGNGTASRLIWEPSERGWYFVRVRPKTGSASGCSASYEIAVTGSPLTFLPLITR